MQADTVRPEHFQIPDAAYREPASCRHATWRPSTNALAPGDSLESLAVEYMRLCPRHSGATYVVLATGYSLDAFISAGSAYSQFFAKMGAA